MPRCAWLILFLARQSVNRKKYLWPALVLGLVLMSTAVELHLQGRMWSCSCGHWLWTSDAWSPQTSQLFLDPYSLTHILHGVMFAGLLALLIRRMSPEWRFVSAIIIESCWEIIENTNTIIDRYRHATAALGYHGDTVVNSLGDITCCAIGFLIARNFGWVRGIIFFVAVELVLVFWIRDSLLLEILMLIYPVDFIKGWQMAR